ncbi:MAG: PEP-CTERM sorting domain-containing protein [Rhodopila sp.]|nr:PEP-CTERM sorting domain-containing protein [Rhodopila sp.]
MFGLFALFAAASHPARAQTFTGTYINTANGNRVDTATAVFSLINGTTLQVVLTNTSTNTAYNNPDLLSGLFFAIAGSPALTPLTATTPSIVNPGACASGKVSVCSSSQVNVGDEWGFVYSASGFKSSTLNASGSQYGIAAAGYSSLNPSFGSSAVFSSGSPQDLGGNCTKNGKCNLKGLDFSIVGSNYASGESSPLSNTSVTYTFALPSQVSSLGISNVYFAYGTAPDGLALGRNVPEPASIAMFCTGIAALGIMRRRKSRPVGRTPRSAGVRPRA